MKVQCDVCEKAQATVLCCADEASLCAECDTRVHAANKLASKHQRVPLLYPSPEDLPCCDICQDKTGYFFCLEDRALLCRNCDYSIHSTNALAANHKRFLVSGIRVALQVISSNETSESLQTCSPPQVSSPTIQASQLSSPTTQISQLSSPRLVRAQKPSRMTPASNSVIKMSTTVPQATSPVYTKGTREESSSTLIASSLPQQQPQPRLGTPTVPEQLRHVLPADGFSPEVVSMSPSTLPSPSINQQVYLNTGRQPVEWGVRSNVNMNPHELSRVELLPNQRGGGGGAARRSSISEYLTEAIPGWRVDELLNLSDMDAIYSFTDCGSSKTDASNFVEVDWPAESSAFDEPVLGDAAAEVPSIPSPPTGSGVPRLTKTWGFGKSLKEPDLDFLLHCDDTLVVPDIGGVTSPTTLSPSSVPQKRRRTFLEV